jgi:acyl carrier protein
MTREEILESLLDRSLAEGLFVPGAQVNPDADLLEAGQIDSMGLVQLQSLIEETFGILVATPVFVAELRSMARIAAYLESEMRAGRARLVVPPAAE